MVCGAAALSKLKLCHRDFKEGLVDGRRSLDFDVGDDVALTARGTDADVVRASTFDLLVVPRDAAPRAGDLEMLVLGGGRD